MVYRTLLDDSAFKVAAGLTSAASGAVSLATGDWAVALFGIPFTVLVAGFAGALIAVAMMPPLNRWYISLGAGATISAYLTSFFALILDKYTSIGDTDDRAVAFFLGLMVYFLLSLFFQDGRDIILGWLRSKFGGPKGGIQ
jgi:hypothetical protein